MTPGVAAVVITLVQRFLAEGEAGLEPRSRRPATALSEAVEDEIVGLRKELDQAGHDSGAQAIAVHLWRRHGQAGGVDHTPAVAFAARPKAFPTCHPVAEGHYRVRHDRVHAGGVLTLRHDSKLFHIGLGRRWAGTQVLVLVHHLHVRVLKEQGDLVRELTRDPSRNYQRQARP